MFLSKRCEYAIRALLFMASHDPKTIHQVSDIASSEGIPKPFLRSILHQLVKAKLLLSFRGPIGGFQLAKPPEQISFSEIVAAVDGLEELETCAHLEEARPQESICSLSARWREICRQILDFYRTTTLAELGRTHKIPLPDWHQVKEGQKGAETKALSGFGF